MVFPPVLSGPRRQAAHRAGVRAAEDAAARAAQLAEAKATTARLRRPLEKGRFPHRRRPRRERLRLSLRSGPCGLGILARPSRSSAWPSTSWPCWHATTGTGSTRPPGSASRPGRNFEKIGDAQDVREGAIRGEHVEAGISDARWLMARLAPCPECRALSIWTSARLKARSCMESGRVQTITETCRQAR